MNLVSKNLPSVKKDLQQDLNDPNSPGIQESDHNAVFGSQQETVARHQPKPNNVS